MPIPNYYIIKKELSVSIVLMWIAPLRYARCQSWNSTEQRQQCTAQLHNNFSFRRFAILFIIVLVRFQWMFSGSKTVYDRLLFIFWLQFVCTYVQCAKSVERVVILFIRHELNIISKFLWLFLVFSFQLYVEWFVVQLLSIADLSDELLTIVAMVFLSIKHINAADDVVIGLLPELT